MIKKLIFRKAFLVSLMLVLFAKLNAQQSNTLYFMRSIPQSNQLNPAFQPSCCKFYIGIPSISGISAYAGNTSLRMKELLNDSASSNEALDPSNESLGSIGNKFRKVTGIYANSQIDILSGGWMMDDWYFSVNFSQKVNLNANIPIQLIDMIYKSDDLPDVFDMNRFGLDFTMYKELALGASKKVSNELNIGFKAKVLFGSANISSKIKDLKVSKINDTIYRFDTDLSFNTSMPFSIMRGNSTNGFPDVTTESITTNDVLSSLTAFHNPGFAIDFGFTYKPIDNLVLSGSILDLGFIRWNYNNFNYKNQHLLNYNILDPSNVSIDTINTPDAILNANDNPYSLISNSDTLKSRLKFTNNTDPYTSMLSAKIYLGAEYYFHPTFSAGILSRTEIFKKRFYEQLIISANYYPAKNFYASINYSLINTRMSGVGIGLGLRLGAFNLYFVSDYVPYVGYLTFSEPIPAQTKFVNARVGINIIIGCKKIRDFPMID